MRVELSRMELRAEAARNQAASSLS
jgi:hypothetical protein